LAGRGGVAAIKVGRQAPVPVASVHGLGDLCVRPPVGVPRDRLRAFATPFIGNSIGDRRRRALGPGRPRTASVVFAGALGAFALLALGRQRTGTLAPARWTRRPAQMRLVPAAPGQAVVRDSISATVARGSGTPITSRA
jgi:hypothetical protein